MMYQCRSGNFNKYIATLVQGFNRGGGCGYVGVQHVWEITVLRIQCCCEPETTYAFNAFMLKRLAIINEDKHLFSNILKSLCELLP